jgi:hypothetical protein
MRTIWKMLTVASLILTGCKGDKKATEAPRPTPADKSGQATRPAASDEYIIKIKFWPDAGQTVAIHQTEKRAGFTKTFQANVWTEQKQDETRESECKQTLLEGGDKLPRKFQRHYEKASRTITGQTSAFIYEGKTIVFELVGNQYRATAEGGGLGPIPLGILATDVNTEAHLEHALVPSKPVRLHETWALEPRTLEEAFAALEGIVPGKSRGQATLAKVYPNQGKQFGVITFEITLAVNQMQNARLEPPLTRTWTGSIDAAIDGSTTPVNASRTGKLTGKAQLDGPDKKKGILEAALETTGRTEQSNPLR